MSSNRSIVSDATSNVRVRMPCELVIEHLLPMIRRELAEELVTRRTISQVQASRILGVTQPAISNYLHTDTKPRSELAARSEIGILARDFSEDLLAGRLTQSDALGRICALCIKMRSQGPICSIHGEEIKELKDAGCLLCLNSIAEFKERSLEDTDIIRTVKQAIKIIESSRELAALIPEIGMNITYAKIRAESTDDVAGVPGRIHPIGGYPRSARPPELGGSSHVARAVLTMIKIQPTFRSAISLKYDSRVIELCKEFGLVVSYFDRAEEPPDVKAIDGRTITWGVELAARKVMLPQVVYDTGDIGKEPMIFLFGKNPVDVATLASEIARAKSTKNRL